MSVTYNFVPVPLDASPATGPSFKLHLLSTIGFPAGTTSGDEIADAVKRHPLFGLANGSQLFGLVMSYADWAKSKTIVAGANGVRRVGLTYAGSTALKSLQSSLADYMARSGSLAVANLKHDAAHDQRAEEDLLDIAAMHDRIASLRAMLRGSATARAGLRAAARIDDLSDRAVGYTRTRWVDGQVQAGVSELLFGSTAAANLSLDKRGAAIVAELRGDISRLRKRLAVTATPDRGNDLYGKSAGGETKVDPRDPNAAMHAALTNNLIARSCGIVTQWTVDDVADLIGDWVVAIDPASFDANSGAACKATAFRRQASTHPLSFRDIGLATTSNGGLATLNDAGGRPRYSCTGINAEMAIVQATLLQAENSPIAAPANMPSMLQGQRGRRDDRPAVELAEQQYGYNELEAAGLTISAPAVDLVTPDALKAPNRETDLPCLFLEDLWIGYRLDLAKSGRPLRSVHRHKQRITFGDGRTISGESEDYWPREAPSSGTSQVSTEIIRYNGLSAAQNVDYAKFLGIYEQPPEIKDAPFTMKVESYSDATRLEFKQRYDYRLRNIFQGCISYSDDDPALAGFDAQFVQSATYARARHFRPGELVAPGDSERQGENKMSVFLTDKERSRRILVAPSPVDADLARYNGQFLTGGSESKMDATRAFVVDLPAFLGTAGEGAPYYCDPDVSAIKVELWMRNGDPQSTERQYDFEDGVYCEMVEPLHVGPVIARFGAADDWRGFRPIEIIVSAASGLRPTIKVEKGGRKVRVSVPMAADLDLVLTPVVPTDQIAGSASFLSSTSVAARAGDGLETAVAGLPVVEHRIRVVHCTRTPVRAPVLVSEVHQGGSDAVPLAILKREPFTDRAELAGYAQVDAASSGDLQIEGAWPEIDDDPVQERYLLKQGRSVSRPRSLQFRDYRPPAPAMALKLMLQGGAAVSTLAQVEGKIGLQCAENRVFMGGSKPAGVPGDTEAPPCILTLGSPKRARLKLTAVAKSRYAHLFAPDPKKSSSLVSRPIDAEVPASMQLPTPIISHVMPLVRQVDGQDRGRRTRQRIYAFRIYVRRPWFLSGHGERLAIGCHTGVPPTGPRDTLNRVITQWGEDPIARSKAGASRRLPRAADFRIAGTPVLDPQLYPADSPEGHGPVLYFDDVVRDPDEGADGDGRLSLASYALAWDDSQKLWFCDAELGNDFTGWIGLALYRHQPQAHENLQLSPSAAWVYSLLLQGERVTWVRQNGITAVTIGPVFDTTLSFEAEERIYRGGVSALGDDKAGERQGFRRFKVDGKYYFEGRFAASGDGIEIIRRRLGNDISSFRLETKA
jgi:hypothetical protein